MPESAPYGSLSRHQTQELTLCLKGDELPDGGDSTLKSNMSQTIHVVFPCQGRGRGGEILRGAL